MRKPIDFMESATRRVRFEPPVVVTDRMIHQFNNGQPVDGGKDVPKVGSIWQTSATPSQGLDAATVERCAQVVEAYYSGHGVAFGSQRAHNYEHAGRTLAARIRALATDPHQHGGKGA